jgi:hypothetical protein
MRNDRDRFGLPRRAGGRRRYNYVGKTTANCFRSPELSISSTDPELLELPKQIFGGTIRHRAFTKEKWKVGLEYRIRGAAAIKAIQALRPWLRHPEKTRRADMILDEYSETVVRNGRYSPMQRAAKESFEARFFGFDKSTESPYMGKGKGRNALVHDGQNAGCDTPPPPPSDQSNRVLRVDAAPDVSSDASYLVLVR